MTKTPETTLTEFISLPELKIINISAKNHSIKCISHIKSRTCPKCGELSHSLYDSRSCKIKDIPLKTGVPPLIIHLKKRRFKCTPCNKIFTEEIGGIKKGKRTTQRFRNLIMWACERFAHLSQVRKDFRVSSDFVYRALYEQLELKRRKNNSYPWPPKIGIDEHGFGKDKNNHRKVFVSMIVNQSNKKLMEMAFGKSKEILTAQLGHIPGRENVQYVTMDMCDPYRSWVKDFFPQAKIVADKFHVLRLLSPSIMKERRVITGTNADKRSRSLILCNSKRLDYFDRKALLKFLERYPKLNALYHAKEAMQSFYNVKGYKRATYCIEKMIMRFKNSVYPELKRLGNTLNYWKEEVLNYFPSRLTNARLEGFNNKASLVRRRAYGYKNPNNYRLRVLSACS